MRPVGIGDVAAVACRDALGLDRGVPAARTAGDSRRTTSSSSPRFGPPLGSTLRRRVVEGARSGAVEARPPGVLVLGPDLKLLRWTSGARAWIDALPAASLFAAWGMLPAMIYPAATLARSGQTERAHALLQAADGRWVIVEAAPLEGAADGVLAVTLRAATAQETFDVVCRACALSRRERDVVALVAAGSDTRAVTQRLFISRHTVQDHLKSAFAKVGVHSRRELLARLNASADAG